MPDNRWYFDNARVGQKLLQVALHRRWLGRIGRAQIDEQQAGSRWRRMIFGQVRHVYRSANKGKVRSEEHTSELQSLMRISYAVFCLKKKNKTQQIEQVKHIHNT